MVIAQLSISPIGVGVSLHRYVREVIRVLEENNIRFQVNDMSTVVEVEDLDTLFRVVKEAHEAVIDMSAVRVITELKIDDRRDKKVHLGDKSRVVQG